MRARNALVIAAVAIFAATGCGKHKKKDAAQPVPVGGFAGSFLKSCRNIIPMDGGFITAECADTHGRFDVSYLKAANCKGDIGNSDGVLVCNGAVATKTPPAPIAASDAAADASASTEAAAAPPKP